MPIVGVAPSTEEEEGDTGLLVPGNIDLSIHNEESDPGIIEPGNIDLESLPVYAAEDKALEVRLRQSFSEASNTDPVRKAKVIELSNKTNLPTDFVERNFDTVSKTAYTEDVDYESIVRDTPGLAKWLENPDNASIAKDDIGFFSGVEKAARSGKGGLYEAFNQIEYARLINKNREGTATVSELAREAEMDKQFERESQRKELEGKSEWVTRQMGYSGAQQLISLGEYAKGGLAGGAVGMLAGPASPITVPIGMTAGALYTGYKYSYELETAFAFKELVNTPGISRATAQKVAPIVGTFNAMIEVGSDFAAAKLLKSIPMVGRLVGLGKKGVTTAVKKALASPTGADALLSATKVALGTSSLNTLEEIVQNWVGVGGREVAQTVDKAQGLQKDSFSKDMWDSLSVGFMTFVGTFLTGGLGSGGLSVLSSVQEIRAAKKTREFYESAAKGIENSSTFKALPEKGEEALASAVGGSVYEKTVIDITSWNSYWQEKNVDPREMAAEVMGDGGKAYDEAKIAKLELVMPTEKYLRKIGPTEHNKFFSQEIRPIDPATGEPGMNFRESEEFRAAMEEQDVEPLVADSLDESARRVREDIEDQLSKIPGQDLSSAVEMERLFKVMGRETGQDPYELYQKYAYGVFGREAVSGQALAQGAGEDLIKMPTNQLKRIRELSKTGDGSDLVGKTFELPNGNKWKMTDMGISERVDAFSGADLPKMHIYSLEKIKSVPMSEDQETLRQSPREEFLASIPAYFKKFDEIFGGNQTTWPARRDDFSVGFTIATSDQSATSEQMYAMRIKILKALRIAVPSSTHVEVSIGMYNGQAEKTFDLKYRTKDKKGAKRFFAELMKYGIKNNQDAMHQSRLLESIELKNPLIHRPGIVINLKTPGDLKNVKPILSALEKKGMNAYTVLMDGGEVTGVSYQYIPEYQVRFDGKHPIITMNESEVPALVNEKYEDLVAMAVDIETSMPEIKSADVNWYETEVRFSHEFKEVIYDSLGKPKGNAGKPRVETWEGRPILRGVESANRQRGIGDAREKAKSILRGGSETAPTADQLIFESHYSPTNNPAEQEESKWIYNNLPETEKAYIAQVVKDYGSARVAAGDIAKTIDVPGRPKFDGATMSESRYPGSSAFSKYYFEKLLMNPKTKGMKVRILAGLGGAGKSSMVMKLRDGDQFAATVDTNLSTVDAGRRVIDFAIDRGRKVSVVYTDRNPYDAFAGIIKRVGQEVERRTLPLPAFENTILSRAVVEQLVEEYRGNSNVLFVFIDNNVTGGKPFITTLEKLPKWVYNEDVRSRIHEAISAAQKEGRITPEEATSLRGGDLQEGNAGDGRQNGNGIVGGNTGEQPQEPQPPPSATPLYQSPVSQPQTKTPEFKKWFGNSKVVDDLGNPLVVYHGTEKGGFETFDPYMVGENTATPSHGFYFTESPQNAATYSGSPKNKFIKPNQSAFEEGDIQSGSYPVYLSIKNPLEVDFGGRNWDGMDAKGEYSGDALGMNDYVNLARGAGNDGVIAKNITDEGKYGRGYHWGELTYVAFSPTQIKSATSNQGAFDPNNPNILMQSPVVLPETTLAPPLYYKIEKLIEEKMPESAPVKQVKAILEGVKEEEKGLSNIDEFLEGKETVSKSELMEYLRMNRLVIKEVILGEPNTVEVEEEVHKLAEELQQTFIDRETETWNENYYAEGPPDSDITPIESTDIERIRRADVGEKDMFGETRHEVPPEAWVVTFDGEKIGTYDSLVEAENAYQYESDKYQEAAREDDEREFRRQLERGHPAEDFYDEARESLGLEDEGDYYEEGTGATPGTQGMVRGGSASKFKDYILKGSMKGYRDLLFIVPPRFEGEFNDPHYGGKHGSVFAQIRYDTRSIKVGGEENSLFMLEEAQAQLHQNARNARVSRIKELVNGGMTLEEAKAKVPFDYGYQKQEDVKELKRLIAVNEKRLISLRKKARKYTDKGIDAPPKLVEKITAADEHAIKLRDAFKGGGDLVMDAPFKKNWHEFLFKRALRLAIEQKQDYFGWTTGKQQVDRYTSALRDRVDKIKWKKTQEGIQLIGFKSGNKVVDTTEKETMLSDAIGKVMADSIIKSADREGEISGEDITIDDTGMAAFYDGMVVDFMNRFVKKWGSKVEMVALEGQGAHNFAGFRRWLAEGPAGREGVNAERAWGIWIDRKVRGMEGVSHKLVEEYLASPLEGERVHAIKITPELARAGLQEGFPMFQRGDAGPRGTFSFVVVDKSGKVSWRGINQAEGRAFAEQSGGIFKTWIELLKGADVTTLSHETSHFFLEVMGDAAAHPNASSQLKEDYINLLRWMGVETRDQIGVKQHEQFARGAEAYRMEGKAPSNSLRRMFAKFKVFFMSIYKSIKDLNVNLTPEFRAIMDRTLASQEEIDLAHAAQPPPLFADPKAAGMSDAQAAAYIAAREEARLSADEEITRKILRDYTRERISFFTANRNRIRGEVEADLNNQTIYRALSILQDGVEPNGDPLPAGMEPFKLSRADIVRQYGEDFVKKLPRGITEKGGGMNPDVAADILGFESGDDLLTQLANTPKKKTMVERLTDQKMAENYPDALNDGTLPIEAVKAVHNDQRAKVLRMELQHIATHNLPVLKEAIRLVARRVPTDMQVRKEAERIIGEKPIKEISPSIYSRAERAAAKEAGEFLAAGDFDSAFASKLRELLNHELYRTASEVLEKVDKSIASFRKMAKSDEKLSKTRDIDLVNAARSILAQYGIGKADRSAASYLDQLQRYDPDVYESIRGIVDSATQSQGNYSDLSYNNFASMKDAVDALWSLSLRSKQIKIEGKIIDREIATQALGFGIDEISKPGERAGYKRAVTTWDKAKMGLMGARAGLRRVESWVNAMDNGDPNGAFRKYIWNPIKDATSQYQEKRKLYLQKYLDIVKTIEKTLDDKTIQAPEIGYEFSGKGELLHALLHTGNESNFSKLLRGRGWGEVDELGNLNSSKWDAFIERAQRDGILTKADYDFVQKTWDLLEELKPMAQSAHKEMYGYYFGEVTAQEFENRFGKYRGGYVPAVADPFITPAAAIREERDVLEKSDNSFMFPTTGRGFTKSRVESYAKPLALDLRYIPAHIDKVLRFVEIEPRVKDVARIIFDNNFRAKLDGFDPTVGGDMLVPWLQRAATQRISSPSGTGWGWKAVDTFFREVRNRTGLNIMVANVVNTLQQFTGLSISALQVKPRNLRSALWEYVKSPSVVAGVVSEKSIFMRNRQTATVIEIQNTIDDLLLNPSKYDKVRDFAKKNGYCLQAATQGIVDTITWTGKYSEAVEAGATEDEAVHQADAAVRETQGSFSPEDMSRYETGTPFMRAFTMFSSYFNMQANVLGTEFIKVARNLGVKGGAGKMFYIYTMGFLIPAVLSEMLIRMGRGRGLDDDDDDHYLDDIMEIFFASQFFGATAMFPFVGPIINAGVNRFNKKQYDDSIRVSPVVSTIESAVSSPASVYGAIVEGKSKRKAIKDSLTLIGLLSGIPVQPLGKPLGYLADVAEGKAQPTGALDFSRGLVTGASGKK